MVPSMLKRKNADLITSFWSGNIVVDVYAGIKRDIINLKFDVMSLLVCVNDVWHELKESTNGVSDEMFYKTYIFEE